MLKNESLRILCFRAKLTPQFEALPEVESGFGLHQPSNGMLKAPNQKIDFRAQQVDVPEKQSLRALEPPSRPQSCGDSGDLLLNKSVCPFSAGLQITIFLMNSDIS